MVSYFFAVFGAIQNFISKRLRKMVAYLLKMKTRLLCVLFLYIVLTFELREFITYSKK